MLCHLNGKFLRYAATTEHHRLNIESFVDQRDIINNRDIASIIWCCHWSNLLCQRDTTIVLLTHTRRCLTLMRSVAPPASQVRVWEFDSRNEMRPTTCALFSASHAGAICRRSWNDFPCQWNVTAKSSTETPIYAWWQYKAEDSITDDKSSMRKCLFAVLYIVHKPSEFTPRVSRYVYVKRRHCSISLYILTH